MAVTSKHPGGEASGKTGGRSLGKLKPSDLRMPTLRNREAWGSRIYRSHTRSKPGPAPAVTTKLVTTGTNQISRRG
jgi:hypothetical protein